MSDDFSNDYKVLLWSDAHKNRPYQRYIGPEIKGTSFGNRNAHGFHEMIKRGDVDAVWHVGDTYSVYVEDYDSDGRLIFDGSTGGLFDERVDHAHASRHNPEADLEYILNLNPDVQHYFALGNHDGGRFEHNDHPFVRFLKRMQPKHPNLHVADQFVMGNMLALHGHQYIDSLRHSKDSETGQIKEEYYPVGRGRHKVKVPERDYEAMAKAICQQRSVQQFAEERSASAPNDSVSKIYVVFGHTHRGFDAIVRLDGPVEAHVINLGALVPGKIPNFKIAYFKDGVVDRIEPINLKQYSASLGAR